MMELKEHFLELIRQASTDLPPDVEKRLREAYEIEDEGTPAKAVFKTILEDVEMARENSTPICQDTGTVNYFIYLPDGEKQKPYIESGIWAAREATRKYYLRPNAVDPVSGKNSGDNTGKNAPYFHFTTWDKDYVEVKLLLKGGGSENVGIQYKLPDINLNAGRDMKGVKKCVIDAVFKAQGYGCAPGTISVGIGGDRTTSYMLAKKNLFRKIGSKNENPILDEMERELEEKLNAMGIGPMGFGGKTTVLDVFIDAQHRHPATFYVSVVYNCWAYRRKTMIIKNGEVSYES